MMMVFSIERPDVALIVANRAFRVADVVKPANTFLVDVREESRVIAPRDYARGFIVPEEISDHGATAGFENTRDLPEVVLQSVGQDVSNRAARTT